MNQGGNARPAGLKSIDVATVPPFKPIPSSKKPVLLKPLGYAASTNGTRPVRNPPVPGNDVPTFQSLPSSITKVQTPIKAPQAFQNALHIATHNFGVSRSVLNLQKLKNENSFHVLIAGRSKSSQQ